MINMARYKTGNPTTDSQNAGRRPSPYGVLPLYSLSAMPKKAPQEIKFKMIPIMNNSILIILLLHLP